MAGNGSIFAPFCDKITLPVRVMVQRGGWAWRGQIFNIDYGRLTRGVANFEMANE